MRKRYLMTIVMVLITSMVLFGCAQNDVTENGTEPENDLVLDRYRGVFEDSGVQQVAIQFDLDQDDTIHNVSFRYLYYEGIDYLELDEDHALYAVLQQYDQIIDYLEGRHIDNIGGLHNPGDFIEDIDTFTGATIRSNKVYSAITDGYNRGVYTPGNGVADLDDDYTDGRYRGTFGDSGYQQVTVQFDLDNNIIENMSFRHLFYAETDYNQMETSDDLYGVVSQHEQIIEHLEGQDIRTALADLHNPGDFISDVDTFTGASVRANKVYSAMMDALNRGVYTPVNDLVDLDGDFEDGRYRGTFSDSGYQQVAVQFDLADNNIEAMSFRHLYYANTDYLEMDESDDFYGVVRQHEQIIEHLVGQDIRTVLNDLHNPGDFISNVDAFTGATVRANKVYSAMMDALARGVYQYR